jgi:tetratricopeptide (TPR) repeat protein
METPNLDENRPTSPKVDEQTHHPETPASPSDQNEDVNATHPMNVSPDKPSIDDTQLSASADDGLNLPTDIPDEPGSASRGSRRWILWAFLGVCVLVLIAAGSAFAGYNSAIEQRTHHQSTLVAGEASNQYVLAQQDIALGNYDRARQRLEYIIQLDPNYPGVSEQLTNVLTQQRITASPTLAPTPTLTPTPDYRTRDELFAQSESLLIGRDWTGVIDTLLLLRKNYPDFMPVKVDGMLFVALRNRGIDKIAAQRDLEGGNYDLTLAERFGPLDGEAQTWREWADLYILGASYWAVDWAQSVYYFSQIANAVPNMSDASGWTAANRYKDALLGYGNWLAARGEWCDAQTQFDTYMTLLADPVVEPTAVHAADECSGGGNDEEPPVEEFTPTPGGPVATETQQPNTTPNP